MAQADSIPRKLIAYLERTLSAGLLQRLYFDSLAVRNDNYPVCLVTACPSIPEQRMGGSGIDPNTRALRCYVSLVWDAADDGRNYDEFESAICEIVDAFSALHGTDAIGSAVLESSIDPKDAYTSIDLGAVKFVAEIEVNILFTR